MVLRRLPRCATTASRPSGLSRNAACQRNLVAAGRRLFAGNHRVLPDPLPCEIYCHSLGRPQHPVARAARFERTHVTVFGLHTPHPAFGAERDALKKVVLSSLNSVLGRTDSGCAAKRRTRLALHRDDNHTRPGAAAANDRRQHLPRRLRWPFAEDHEQLDTPLRNGAWPPATNAFCCVAQGRAAAVRSPVCGGQTPRWRYSRRSGRWSATRFARLRRARDRDA